MTIADGTTHPKVRSKHTAKETKTGHGNSQALNVIFSGVGKEQFNMISTYELTK